MTTMPEMERDAGATGSDRWVRTIRLTAWLLALTLGALQVWAERYPIGEDGLSYLEIADAYIRGDWQNAVNAYWSPLYSWVLAAGLGLTRPTPYLESTVVHIINFLIYVCALASFEFFLRQLLVVHGRRAREAAEHGDMRVPASALLAVAYGLFIWISVEWISVSLESPDMCLTIFIYLATGLLIRMRARQPSTLTFVGYGIVLGLAYLTKSAMFPLSVVYFVLLFLNLQNRAVAWRGVAAAVVAFGLVSGPYITAISLAKGRVTIGDTGKLAYIWFANGATDRELHWWREFPDDHRAVHPSRKVLAHPAVYEFGADPVGGTYPVWYDPSYWHEGEKPHVDLRGQLRVLRWSAQEWWRIFVTDSDFVMFGVFILVAVAGGRWSVLRRELAGYAELLIPFVAALAMYSLVLLSPRYVAVFLLLFWIGILATVRLPQSSATRRLAWAVPFALLFMIALRLAPLSGALIQSVRAHRTPQAHRFWDIAEGLRQLGAKPSDKVAIIGYGPPAYWARLARVRIVAEMFSEEPDFLSAPGVEEGLQPDGSFKPEVIRAFAGTGAKFVIARRVPQNVAQHGWTELGDRTRWYAYPLRD